MFQSKEPWFMHFLSAHPLHAAGPSTARAAAAGIGSNLSPMCALHTRKHMLTHARVAHHTGQHASPPLFRGACTSAMIQPPRQQRRQLWVAEYDS